MRAQKVFISYAHEDEDFSKELQAHMKLLEKQGLVKCWHDREIIAGTKWKGEINKNLKSADLILLLISSDFLNSDYCYDVEMKAALDAHKVGKSITIPIIIRPVTNWENSELGGLQALPRDGKPVVTWDFRDLAWADVTAGIIRAVQHREAEQEPHGPGKDFSADDVLKNLSSYRATLDKATSEADEMIIKRNIGNLFFSHPNLAGQVASYQAEKTSYNTAGKKAYQEIMALLDTKLPMEMTMMSVIGLIAEHEEKNVKLNLLLFALLDSLENAGLAPGDYGLPSIESTGQVLDGAMKKQADLMKALVATTGEVNKNILEPIRKLRK